MCAIINSEEVPKAKKVWFKEFLVSLKITQF